LLVGCWLLVVGCWKMVVNKQIVTRSTDVKIFVRSMLFVNIFFCYIQVGAQEKWLLK
jgi:hypothetical protein